MNMVFSAGFPADKYLKRGIARAARIFEHTVSVCFGHNAHSAVGGTDIQNIAFKIAVQKGVLAGLYALHRDPLRI